MELRKTSLACVTALLLTTPAGYAASLYGTNFGGTDDLFNISTATGAASSVGNTGNDDIGDLTSDFHTIWGIDLGGVNNLLEIDRGTGAASVVSTVSGAVADIVSIAFDTVSGVLYGNTSVGFGAAADELYSIDIGTGVATSVGRIGFNDVFALSFDTSGNLFGVSNDTGDLISIDTGTGAGGVIGSIGLGFVFDLAYDPDSGDMFASAAGMGSLFAVDTGTAANTFIGDYANIDASNIAGLAFVSEVPIPATLPLLLAGIGAFGVLRRRQKA